MSDVLQFVFIGLGLGAMYALGSLGLIVVYRGSGVLNLAQGAIGMAGAYAVYDLTNRGVPWAVAAPVGLLASAVLGVVVHFGIINRLQEASPLARTVATLGVLITLQAAANLRYGPNPVTVPNGFGTKVLTILDTRVTSDRLVLVLFASVLTSVLWSVYRYTSFGRATTAVADNQRAAAALGTSPSRVAGLNWALGSMLGGASAILAAPLINLSPVTMTTLLLASLAVALLASFRSFPLALIGGLTVGVAQVLVQRYVDQLGISQAVPFIVIIVVMTLGGRSLPLRDYMFQRLPTLGTGRIRPVPVLALVLVTAVWVPTMGTVWQDAFIALFSVGVILLSIVFLTGYAGQLSLGQFALAGLGAFVSGRLMAAEGWSFAPALLVGTVLCIPVGVLFALPAVRSRGINLAIVTLGLGSALEFVVFNNEAWTGGYYGTAIPSPTVFGWSIDPVLWPERYLWVVLASFAAVAVLVANTRRGRSGRRLLAIRTNERAAAALGVDVTVGKLFAFGISAAIAGLGGCLLAFRFANVSYLQFTTFFSILLVCYAVLGGIGWIAGALLGATLAPGSLGVPIADALVPGLGGYVDLIGGVTIIVIVLTNQSGMAMANLHAASAVGRRLGRVVPWRVRIPGWWPTLAANATLPSLEHAHRVPARTLHVRNMVVRYGGVTAVDDVSFDVRPGQIVGLIGPNGAGKTSVIDAVTGFAKMAGGSVALDGRDLSRLKFHQRARLGLSRSFQSLELFEDSSVFENVQTASDPSDLLAYVVDPLRPNTTVLSQAAVAAIHEFGLERMLETPAEDLSYGQRRLLAIARAVAAGPSVMLLDEPAAGLGEVETAELARLVRRLAEEWGMGILVVEHDMSFVMSLCDELVVMDFGRPIAADTPAKVRQDPAVLAAYLGQSQDETEAGPGATADTRVSSVRDLDTTPRPEAESALLCEGLAVGYHGEPVVTDIALSVQPGEVVALLGANGAGKSTVIAALAGELPVMAGTVSLFGVATSAPLHRRAKLGVSLVPEERSIFRGMTLRDNLRVGDADPELALHLFPELTKRLDVRGGLLSGGEQQMLSLGRALSRRPRLLLADELSLGLAPMVATRLLTAIRAAADENGTSVVLVEQHVSKALRYADYAYVLRRGRIEVSGPAAELRSRIDDIQATYMSAGAAIDATDAPNHLQGGAIRA